MNFSFFSSTQRTFSRIDHILGHKSSLGKFKEIEIIPSIFSDHNEVRLDINYRRKTIKNSNIWRLNNTLQNNQQITTEKIKICLERNENENITTQNLWDTVKAVLSTVQSLSCVQLFATPWTTAHQASLSITNSQSSLRLTSIKPVMPSSHLILCHPLLLLPPIPPSIRVFSNESTLCMRWPKYWSFNFSIIPSKEMPGLISFRMDWLDLLGVQGILKSLL